MNLPLIIGARPPYCKAGAQVPLIRGEWEITLQGHIDSVLYLWSDRAPTRTPLDGKPLRISGSRTIRIVFEKPGTEEHISAFARRVA